MPRNSQTVRHGHGSSNRSRGDRSGRNQNRRRGRSPGDELFQRPGEGSRHHHHHHRSPRPPRRRHHHHHKRARDERRMDSRSPSEGSDISSSGSNPVNHRDQRRRRLESPQRSRARLPAESHGATAETRGADHRMRLLSALDEQLAAHCRRLEMSKKVVERKDTPLDNSNATGGSSGGGGVSIMTPGTSGSSVLSPSCRVVLYGVDLGVKPCHISSMLEQLVGLHPLDVVRPAAQLWESVCAVIADQEAKATASTITENGGGAVGTPAGDSQGIATAEGITSATVEHRGIPDGCRHLGLYEVGAAGGIVILDLPQASDVATVVAALNGACLNGRFISAAPAVG